MKRLYSVENGKMGGRPKVNTYVTTFVIPEINTVVLTENQYKILIERYGKPLLEKALIILEDWLNTSRLAVKYKGKNNYALFRADGWVINEAAKNRAIQQI